MRPLPERSSLADGASVVHGLKPGRTAPGAPGRPVDCVREPLSPGLRTPRGGDGRLRFQLPRLDDSDRHEPERLASRDPLRAVRSFPAERSETAVARAARDLIAQHDPDATRDELCASAANGGAEPVHAEGPG
jgi:hypothetical protein